MQSVRGIVAVQKLNCHFPVWTLYVRNKKITNKKNAIIMCECVS